MVSMAYARCCCIGDVIIESESVGGEFAEVDVSGAAFVGDGFFLATAAFVVGAHWTAGDVSDT